MENISLTKAQVPENGPYPVPAESIHILVWMSGTGFGINILKVSIPLSSQEVPQSALVERYHFDFLGEDHK
jgi:hypothetical protein